jgi:hypothetical protein
MFPRRNAAGDRVILSPTVLGLLLQQGGQAAEEYRT